jgi:hypothetical protein
VLASNYTPSLHFCLLLPQNVFPAFERACLTTQHCIRNCKLTLNNRKHSETLLHILYTTYSHLFLISACHSFPQPPSSFLHGMSKTNHFISKRCHILPFLSFIAFSLVTCVNMAVSVL